MNTFGSVVRYMDQVYRCEACGQEFESRSELLRHTYDVGLVD